MRELTDRQKQILKGICRHLEMEGRPPSFRELCQTYNIKSTNGIKCHFDSLERKGYIVQGAGTDKRSVMPAGMRMQKVECLSPDGKWIFSGFRPVIDGGKKGQRLLAALATT